MTIELISIEDHKKLLDIYKDFPALTLQNKGYQYIQKDKLTDVEKEKMKEVSAILSSSIKGYNSFSNFRLSKEGRPEIRLQYNYNHDGGIPFVGVGYILIDELKDGFKN